ncbi:hypothetical protein [Pediococcus parvulus]|uniref:hypothetical protein n=1 Tax=Pediococcus parvulus TaxID=54062 RepID=UPI00070E3D13|nr:hypothetical protein [Pediococcus parvulus]MCT3027336.1 hypothetical protein [Pediococcus parvulus]GEL89314.1 hypothetical protein PPA04_05450 [Pediococcus parvulus]GHC07417.1 hypothetical protein GCM10008912_08720 [Pediococcus parvulus]
MDELDRQLLSEYLYTQSRKNTIKGHLKELESIYHNYSFISSPFAYESDGMTPVRHPPFDIIVNDFVDMEQEAKQCLQIEDYKHREFMKYWGTLSQDEQTYLKQIIGKCEHQKNNNVLEIQTLNEIHQIEEATGHKFNLSYDVAIDQITNVDDVQSTMNQVLGMLTNGQGL